MFGFSVLDIRFSVLINCQLPSSTDRAEDLKLLFFPSIDNDGYYGSFGVGFIIL